ncbi:uncharacterized protein PHACADRAFT_265157 [Phanerochaete carnosa HHB-10118-sp]|uniref:Uncharacterized protein n=1 Tax=Phanerochaete carnosa (strain HHB-10118-sp) TaxID=650164 RepID=K5VS54_PHACS|nr:uncharacterized protein PHACADRAFT_265157 [Phanerochaete carnosa HHB-10118-sp]EKM49610.1 hypothetical protein PHACADRAFT_265157 [Phanerochaete carnosa HHB-10118-sp]
MPASSTRQSTVAVLALLVLSVAVSIASMSRRTEVVRSPDLLQPDAVQYGAMDAYLLAHFPEDVGCAEMTFEETSHYDVNRPESHAEWTMLWPVWSHAGFVRLGPEQRKLQVAMYHQLHCVHVFVNALSGTGNRERFGHISHCFDYLRRTFLCAADTTLEPYDFLEREFDKHPVGITRQCRDWSVVIGAIEDNYYAWRNLSSVADGADEPLS